MTTADQFYIDDLTGNLYLHENGVWLFKGNVGPNGVGHGPPEAVIVGLYIDVDSSDIYFGGTLIGTLSGGSGAGPPGARGLPGVPGDDGADGEDAPIIPGPAGAAGAAGAQGIPGQFIVGDDGAPGEDAPIIPGPQGVQGSPGLPGVPGDDGADGEDAPIIPGPAGAAGAAGAQGIPGQFIVGDDGAPGEDAPIIPGPQGVQGSPGLPGVPGDVGTDGEDAPFALGPLLSGSQGYTAPYTGSRELPIAAKLGEVISFADFGIADGSTNNDTAWTNFINAVVASGRAGYVPGGASSYLVPTATVSVSPTLPFILFGEGIIERSTEVYGPLLEIVGAPSPLVGQGLTFKYSGPNPQRTITGVTTTGSTSVTYSYTGAVFTLGESVTTFGILGMGAGDTNGNLTGTISALGTGTFTINVNGSTWSAYGSGGVAYFANAGNHQPVRLNGCTNGRLDGGISLGQWYCGPELRDPTGGAISNWYSKGWINRGLYLQAVNLASAVGITTNIVDGFSASGDGYYGINTNVAAGKSEANITISGNRVSNTLSQGIGAAGAVSTVITGNTILVVSGVGGTMILLEIINSVIPQYNIITGNVGAQGQIGISCNDDLYTVISNNNMVVTIPAAAGSTPTTCIALQIQGSQEGGQSNNVLTAVANTPHSAIGLFVGPSGAQNASNNLGARNKIVLGGTSSSLVGIVAVSGSVGTEWLMTKIENATTAVSDAGSGNVFSTGTSGAGNLVLASAVPSLAFPTATVSNPVPPSGGGAMTTASSTLYSRVDAGKLASVAGSITVTTIGSGSGSLILPLPFTPAIGCAMPVEDASAGTLCVGYVNPGDAHLYIWATGFGSPLVAGHVYYFGGSFYTT